MMGGLFDSDHQAPGLLLPLFRLCLELTGRERFALFEEGGYSE
jgi:hypothetical protein